MAAEGEVTKDDLRIGDRFRISVALLREIYDMPSHQSELVELVEVRLEPDSTTKVLVMKRAFVS